MVQKKTDIKKTFTGNKETYKRGLHPNSKSNLTPFTKGVSGNPKGRPYKFIELKKVLDEIGNEVVDDMFNNIEYTKREKVLKKICKEAMSGDMKFIQFLASLGCLVEE